MDSKKTIVPLEIVENEHNCAITPDVSPMIKEVDNSKNANILEKVQPSEMETSSPTIVLKTVIDEQSLIKFPSDGDDVGAENTAPRMETETAQSPIQSEMPTTKLDAPKVNIDFKVIYNKKKYDVTLSQDDNILSLKEYLQPIISVAPHMMKVMIKGLAKDEMTLSELGVTKSSKVMVVGTPGSTLSDVINMSAPPKESPIESLGTKESSTDSSKVAKHKKILDKGKPDDAMPGKFGAKEHLPLAPLTGMLNHYCGKVRLSFNMASNQLCISTKQSTQKFGFNEIKDVVSEPIDGHKEYHILALQFGPTEASRYWIYWVPAQYVEAIKDCILGKWQAFPKMAGMFM